MWIHSLSETSDSLVYPVCNVHWYQRAGGEVCCLFSSAGIPVWGETSHMKPFLLYLLTWKHAWLSRCPLWCCSRNPQDNSLSQSNPSVKLLIAGSEKLSVKLHTHLLLNMRTLLLFFSVPLSSHKCTCQASCWPSYIRSHILYSCVCRFDFLCPVISHSLMNCALLPLCHSQTTFQRTWERCVNTCLASGWSRFQLFVSLFSKFTLGRSRLSVLRSIDHCRLARNNRNTHFILYYCDKYSRLFHINRKVKEVISSS